MARRTGLRLLSHPVVWAGYASMAETERGGVLNADDTYLSRLAKILCDRFLLRCRTRRSWRDQSLLLPALSAISRATLGAASLPSYTINDWDTAGDAWVDKTEVKLLYNECLSYGLVERDGRSNWRWSHQIVARYLATLTEGSE